MNLILIALLVLGITGLVAAVLLYLIAQKFKVEEDPRIDLVQEVLPGANCGGCGFAGCRALAEVGRFALSCRRGGDDGKSGFHTGYGGCGCRSEGGSSSLQRCM